MTPQDHLVNPELLKIARATMGVFGVKQAFVPGGDMSGGGGAPPGGDPSGGMGGPPPGGDPSGGAGGGGPPPGGGGGGGGDPMAALQPMIQQMVQQAMMQGGGMGGGMGGGAGAKNPLTPKIDEKAVMLQILKILARVADQLGVKIPASEMVVTQNDMQGLAQASASGGPMPGMDPSTGAGGGGAGGAGGAIPPMDPMQGMQPSGAPGQGGEKAGSYRSSGVAFDSSGLSDVSNRASAIARMRKMAA